MREQPQAHTHLGMPGWDPVVWEFRSGNEGKPKSPGVLPAWGTGDGGQTIRSGSSSFWLMTTRNAPELLDASFS